MKMRVDRFLLITATRNYSKATSAAAGGGAQKSSLVSLCCTNNLIYFSHLILNHAHGETNPLG